MLMFSIKPKWASMIARKEKTYELRRRPPTIGAVGKVALIYSSSPVSRVICACKIEEIVTLPRQELWDRVGAATGCTLWEFENYFGGLPCASAIRLSLIEGISVDVSRGELIAKYKFAPPQSWRWADDLADLVSHK